MKSLRKIMALLIAMVMVLGMSVSVFAEGDTSATYKLTLDNTAAETEHQFEIYQIFTGDLSTNDAGGKVLSNVVWGNGVQTTYTTGKKASDIAKEITTQDQAEAFAAQLQDHLQNPQTVTAAKGAKVEINNLVAGYYLVRDVAKSQDGKEFGSYSAYILQVVGNAEQATKTDAPEVEKKVADDLTAEDIIAIVEGTKTNVTWQDSADYDINDKVPYQITAKMGAKIGEYEKYKVTITDTLSAGLTYDNNAKVYVGEKDVTNAFTISYNNGTLTIHSDDVKVDPVKATANTEIVVKYSATLNEHAVVGVAGNPNTVTMSYSNNPNDKGEGEHGTTPSDKVIVFTFDVKVDKVDPGRNPLEGAAFKLEKDGKVVKEYTVKADQTSFDFKGLDAGTYILTETVTPTGYNTIAPITFVIEAEHEVYAVEPKLTSLVVKDSAGKVVDSFEIELTKDTNKPTGNISTEVINQSGSTLPSTGGMGTTLFYIVGGILVAGAAIILIAKRKVNA